MIYSFTPKAAGDRLTFSTSDTGSASQILVFSPAVSIMDIVANGASGAQGGPAVFTATSAAPVYVLVYDGLLAGSVSASLSVTDTSYTVQAGGEGNDTANNTFAGAVTITTPPAKLTGMTLSSESDVDYYKVTVPAARSSTSRPSLATPTRTPSSRSTAPTARPRSTPRPTPPTTRTPPRPPSPCRHLLLLDQLQHEHAGDSVRGRQQPLRSPRRPRVK